MENRKFNMWASEEKNAGLWEATAEGCWYCQASCVMPGETASNGYGEYYTNTAGSPRSLWNYSVDNVYSHTEWRDAK